ncbi:MAG TPA: DUF6629 family protein [Candidatus Saccharimonadales bacterium]
MPSHGKVIIMCFSPTASFVAGGGLSVIGIASLTKARKRDKLLAAIPLLFGIQQILEGLQWLALNMHQVAKIPLYGFLFFSSVFWPAYIPLIVFLLDKKRQRITRWFLAVGGGLSLFNLWTLLTNPATAQITNHSIQYVCSVATQTSWLSGIYLLATGGSLLISSVPILRLLGIISAIGVLIAYFFYSVTFVSVWCFFAAILSSVIYFYVRNHNRRPRQATPKLS